MALGVRKLKSLYQKLQQMMRLLNSDQRFSEMLVEGSLPRDWLDKEWRGDARRNERGEGEAQNVFAKGDRIRGGAASRCHK